jgi:hypothetical protein
MVSAGPGTVHQGAGGGRRPHTWMTATRCALGRPGSSTSLPRSSRSLVSSTTGRSRSRAVAATTASIAQRWPERPAVPSSSPACRPVCGLTGTTVTRDSTRCTGASRGPPRSSSVSVIALTTTPARRARAVRHPLPVWKALHYRGPGSRPRLLVIRPRGPGLAQIVPRHRPMLRSQHPGQLGEQIHFQLACDGLGHVLAEFPRPDPSLDG